MVLKFELKLSALLLALLILLALLSAPEMELQSPIAGVYVI